MRAQCAQVVSIELILMCAKCAQVVSIELILMCAKCAQVVNIEFMRSTVPRIDVYDHSQVRV